MKRTALPAFLLLGLLSALPAAQTRGRVVPGDTDLALQSARAWRGANGHAFLRELAELLRLPNVSSDGDGIRRNAAAIAAAFERRGAAMEVVELPAAEGGALPNPVVVGRLETPGATRTLGVYVHYDGQPVDAEAWTFPPFEPTLTDRPLEEGGRAIAWPEAGDPIHPESRLYARGSGDDRAPLYTLLAALDALAAADLPPSVNLVFLFEGEEEVGSTHLAPYLDLLRPRLQADLWLICDGPLHQSRRPQLVFGVRGITTCEITVFGGTRNLHSGHYGNWAPNPSMMLAQLLASMKDADGNVLVEGFHDTVQPLGEAERAALAATPAVDEALRGELGLARTEGDGSLAQRLLLPSLNVRGLDGGPVGAGARNVIPTEATAALDIRLVRGNDPGAMLDLLEAHVVAQGYHVVREDPDHATRLAHGRIAKIVRGGGYPAVRTAMDAPGVEDLVRAVERAAGEAPILTPSLGGSLPLYLFVEKLGAPLVIVPIANHDDNQHAPDENMRVANLWYGIDLFAALLTL